MSALLVKESTENKLKWIADKMNSFSPSKYQPSSPLGLSSVFITSPVTNKNVDNWLASVLQY